VSCKIEDGKLPFQANKTGRSSGYLAFLPQRGGFYVAREAYASPKFAMDQKSDLA
jgi:hypothetical protein